jgi:hypothetical protein
MIRENFRRAGEDLHGVPFVPPRIVIWNLRAEYSDFHARAAAVRVLRYNHHVIADHAELRCGRVSMDHSCGFRSISVIP